MDHTFFPAYRKTLLAPEEILLSIEIPYSREVSCSGASHVTLTAARLQTRDQSLPRGPSSASLNFNKVSEHCLSPAIVFSGQ